MRFSILTLFAFLPSVALSTLASPTSCPAEYCPRALEPRAPLNRVATPTPTPTLPQLTNGQRLARGLPIKPPRRRATVSARAMLPRASSVPRANFRGVIAVTDKANGQILGYISRNSFSHAQYRYQPSINDALVVYFSIDASATVGYNVHINSENSDTPGFPVLSLVQGRDDTSVDFAQGSFNYGYIAGMAEPGSGPDSVPVTSPANTYTTATGSTRAALSNVWLYNTQTMTLEPQWVNSDGSKPTTATFSQGSALYVGGDQGAFASRYPSPVTAIGFNFVPLP